MNLEMYGNVMSHEPCNLHVSPSRAAFVQEPARQTLGLNPRADKLCICRLKADQLRHLFFQPTAVLHKRLRPIKKRNSRNHIQVV